MVTLEEIFISFKRSPEVVKKKVDSSEEEEQSIKDIDYSKFDNWRYSVNGEEPTPISPITVQFLSALNNLGDESLLSSFYCRKPSDQYIEELIKNGYVTVFTEKNYQCLKVSDDMKKANYIPLKV